MLAVLLTVTRPRLARGLLPGWGGPWPCARPPGRGRGGRRRPAQGAGLGPSCNSLRRGWLPLLVWMFSECGSESRCCVFLIMLCADFFVGMVWFFCAHLLNPFAGLG